MLLIYRKICTNRRLIVKSSFWRVMYHLLRFTRYLWVSCKNEAVTGRNKYSSKTGNDYLDSPGKLTPHVKINIAISHFTIEYESNITPTCVFFVYLTGRERGMFSDGTDTISFRLSRMSTRYSFTADMLMNGRIVQQEPFLWTRSYTRWMKRTSQIFITCLTLNKIFKNSFPLLPIVGISATVRRWIENNNCSMEF